MISQIPLVALSLYDWQKDADFILILNLNVLEELAQRPVAENDNIIITVTDQLKKQVDKKDFTLTAVSTDRMFEASFGTLNNLISGQYIVNIDYPIISATGVAERGNTDTPIFVPDPVKANQPVKVNLQSTAFEKTPSQGLWEGIKNSTLDFRNMQSFVDHVLCKPVTNFTSIKGLTFDADQRKWAKNRLPFINVDEYSLVKYAIDTYMRVALRIDKEDVAGYPIAPLPYYNKILGDHMKEFLTNYATMDGDCLVRSENMLNGFLAIELIWSYWTEQAMLDQAMGAISLRFQNMRGLHAVEPMMRFDTSPLMPVSNLLWGFIQDEQHRTTINRRVFEYQHAYNLTLLGKAVPRQRGVDNRSPFLNAFHSLLHQASLFYNDYDDQTRAADAFPLLIAMRDVHLLLAEGNHNAYFNMTYTTRVEKLTMQYLLSQQEMQTFLGGRAMIPLERHMSALDTVKTIQGWDPVGTLHYYELANTGERLLLGLRYGNWADDMFNSADAGNWAVAFRDDISTYINAYRNVTGIDLSANSSRISPEDRGLQPAMLIQRRLANVPQRNYGMSQPAYM